MLFAALLENAGFFVGCMFGRNGMNTKELSLSQLEVHKLLASGNADAALLHLFLRCGNEPNEAETALGFSGARMSCASATLRQLGLWPEENKMLHLDQPPQYTEQDVTRAISGSDEFRMLVGEVQRVLGRILTTEELKLLLSFRNYLDLPVEVVSMLVCYCKDRMRRRGSNRNPSLRTIEKEAYAWAERGINTIDEAVAFMQAENARYSRMAQLQRLLQIGGRSLTPAEERYARSWLDMDFDSEALELAYEKTCLNTGGLKWPYMNKILLSWHQQGLHTGAEIKAGDKKPTGTSGAARNAVAQTQQVQAGSAGLGEFERDAIARMLREYQQEG